LGQQPCERYLSRCRLLPFGDLSKVVNQQLIYLPCLRRKTRDAIPQIGERMLKARQLIRETSRSLIEIALEVGYTSPSHFAQVFRRTAGMAPTEFRMLLE
jgi:AraC family transcriptional regulator